METNNSSDIPSVYRSTKQKGFLVARLIQRRLIILLTALVMLECGVFARTSPPPVSNGVSRPPQVAVIASQYFITDMLQGTTSAHLRLLLESVRPNILAVEAPANMADPWQYASFDLQKVIKPWAKQHNIPMVPVGHLDLKYDQQVNAMLKYFEEKKLLRQYQTIDDKFRFAGSAHKFSFKFINSSGYDDIWRNYNSGLSKIYRQSISAEKINEKIAANVIKLCKANPGRRIVVVINAPHCYYIKDKLRDSEGINFLNLENSLNFQPGELAKKTLPQDYLYALRVLTIDDFSLIQPAEFSHLETCLNRIRRYPEFRYDHAFFYGKMLLHSRDPRSAESHFRAMTITDPKIVLQFDNETSVREAALVYVAIANLQMNKMYDAILRLSAIMEMPDVSEKTKKWVNQILVDIKPPGVTVDLDQ